MLISLVKLGPLSVTNCSLMLQMCFSSSRWSPVKWMTLICHVNLHPLGVQVNQDGEHVSQEGTSVVLCAPSSAALVAIAVGGVGQLHGGLLRGS